VSSSFVVNHHRNSFVLRFIVGSWSLDGCRTDFDHSVPISEVFVTDGVWFEILLENYDGTFTQITETLSNDPTNQLTGDVSVSLSSVPTEFLEDRELTLKTGYIFSYFSTSHPLPSLLLLPPLRSLLRCQCLDMTIKSGRCKPSRACGLWRALFLSLEV